MCSDLFRRWMACVLWLMLFTTSDARPAAGLDISSCPKGNDECVEKFYRIKVFQLKTEQHELRVASDRRLEEEEKVATQHRMSTLWAQYIAGWIMLGLGLCIIVAGLIMSWLQMAKGWNDQSTLESAFEVSAHGVKLKSPVIGLFIFIASIYFFQLYISEVYRITDVIDRKKNETAAAKPAVARTCAAETPETSEPSAANVAINDFDNNQSGGSQSNP